MKQRRRQHSNPPRAARIATAALSAFLLFAGACQTMSSPEGIQSVREVIEKGSETERREAVREIVDEFDEIPPGLQDEAVRAIGESPDKNAQEALIQLLDDPRVQYDETREVVVQELVERGQKGESGSESALLAAAEKNPRLANEELIRYFGARQYAPAIPLLKKQVEAKNELVASLKSLAQMEDPETYDYILSLVFSQNPALRSEALRTISEIDDERVQAKAAPVYASVLADYKNQPREFVVLAMEELGEIGGEAIEPEQVLPALKKINNETEDPELKQLSLAAMARIQGVDTQKMAELLQPKKEPVREKKEELNDADSNLEYARQRERERLEQERRESAERERKRTVVRPKPGRRPSNYPENYADVLARNFNQAFGAAESRSLQARINNAFLAYSDQPGDPRGEFFYRAYRKQWGDASLSSIREMMNQGLRHPGSLSVVVWNIIDEYPSDPLRKYALSKMFEIKRWQAELILNMVRNRRI